jgi:serine/threonine-protein kinase RsbW
MATELIITSHLAGVRHVPDLIEETLRANAYAEHDIFAIKLALEEALVNAIKHGNQMDPDKRVYVTYTITAERYDIRISGECEEPGNRSVTGRKS